jgi:hypothetical protein
MSVSAVKIKVTIAQPFVIAGTPFSITTTVENAHEATIDILEFMYHIPYQMQWIDDAKYNAEFVKMDTTSWYKKLIPTSSWKKTIQPPGQSMIYGMLQTPDQPIFSVLSGESTSYSFNAIVSKWLFISGSELIFPGRIKYRYNEMIHYAPFEVHLVLRPPLLANSLGALTGSVLGNIARSLKDQGAVFLQNITIEFISTSVLASILAIIAVVYSSRRSSESQPILTVEDFFGGLIIGFMIGYLGNSFFQRVVPIL